MKKLKLIYNPMSGSKSFKDDIDLCISILQEGGYEVSLFRSAKVGDIEKHIAKMSDDIDVLVISGGDGTINRAVNTLMERGLDIPIGIIQSEILCRHRAHFIAIRRCCKNCREVAVSTKYNMLFCFIPSELSIFAIYDIIKFFWSITISMHTSKAIL